MCYQHTSHVGIFQSIQKTNVHVTSCAWGGKWFIFFLLYFFINNNNIWILFAGVIIWSCSVWVNILNRRSSEVSINRSSWCASGSANRERVRSWSNKNYYWFYWKTIMCVREKYGSKQLIIPENITCFTFHQD